MLRGELADSWPMDETRILGLSKVGTLVDCDVLGRAAVPEGTIPFERLLHAHFVGLVAACVFAAVLAGCASPAARDPRDATAAGSSPAEPSAAASPRFAQGGPDAEDYGASSGYPVGDRATCFRFRVGCYSHFDQVYEGRLVRRATTPSPLERAASTAPRKGS